MTKKKLLENLRIKLKLAVKGQLDKKWPITIIGAGVTGKSCLHFLLMQGFTNITVLNAGDKNLWGKQLQDWLQLNLIQTKRLENLKFIELPQDEQMDEAKKSNIIKILEQSAFFMRSPGIDPRRNIFTKNLCSEKEIGEIELAYNFLTAFTEFQKIERPKIIAVTGTNGKTTTVEFLKHLLDLQNKATFLGGNVGKPFTDLFCLESGSIILPEFIILELSSFQVEQLQEFECDLGVILNITESHQERYNNFQEYFDAKIKLISHIVQTDKLPLIISKELNSLLNLEQVIEVDTALPLNKSKEINNELALIGKHNAINADFCLRVLKYFSLSPTVSHFSSFKGVDFRCQNVYEDQDVLIINDSKSTNLEATQTALNAALDYFPAKNIAKVYLIMGGKLRSAHQNFVESITPILSRYKFNIQLFIFGDTAKNLSSSSKIHVKENLVEVMQEIYSLEKVKNMPLELDQTDRKTIILFSPGHPSFDQYKNYVERGNHFNKLLNQLRHMVGDKDE